MHDEVAERRRRAATVDYQSGIPKSDMSVDGTFFLASKMNMSEGMELSYEFDGDALTNHSTQFATPCSSVHKLRERGRKRSWTRANCQEAWASNQRPGHQHQHRQRPADIDRHIDDGAGHEHRQWSGVERSGLAKTTSMSP